MRDKVSFSTISKVNFRVSPPTFASLAALSLVMVWTQPTFAADPTPSVAAQSIAKKFSDAASADEPQKQSAINDEAARKKAVAAKKRAEAVRAATAKAASVRKADEAEMLLRANTEASAREADQKRADEELAQAVDAATAARIAALEAAERTKQEAVARAKAEMAEREQAEETEAVRRVAENRKREQEALTAAQHSVQEPDRQQVIPTADQHTNPAVQPRSIDDTTAVRNQAQPEDERRALTRQREAETLQLAAHLKEARRAKAAELERAALEQNETEARQVSERKAAVQAAERENEAKLSAAASQPSALQPTPAAVTAATPPLQQAAAPLTLFKSGTARATVLLMLNPGNYGIRRFNQAQADPVLCAGEVCYVSQGPDTAAKAMPRKVALGAGNTLGTRAGACKLQLACIFRDVDFGSGLAPLQPVDLHVLRHDRREITTASADTSCNVIAGSLMCGSPIEARTYRAWIVPESIATTAGGSALTAALQLNLSTRRAAAN